MADDRHQENAISELEMIGLTPSLHHLFGVNSWSNGMWMSIALVDGEMNEWMNEWENKWEHIDEYTSSYPVLRH